MRNCRKQIGRMGSNGDESNMKAKEDVNKIQETYAKPPISLFHVEKNAGK